MKRCPQCRAEYDDHVEYCFVDGAELVPHTGMLQITTPLPPPPAPNRSLLPMLLVLGVMGMLMLSSGLVLIVFLFMEPKVATVEPNLPEVQPPPNTLDVDGEDIMVEITSSPPGARVFEGAEQVCPSTPCQIPHPTGEGRERRLTFKLQGFQDRTESWSDPHTPWKIKLLRKPVPKPLPQPAAPKPSLSIEDER